MSFGELEQADGNVTLSFYFKLREFHAAKNKKIKKLSKVKRKEKGSGKHK